MDDASRRVREAGWRARWRVLLGMLLAAVASGLVAVGSAGSARAQAQLPLGDLELRGPGPAATLAAGVHLMEADRAGEALPLLQRVVATRPAFVGASHGAAATWLGAAYTATGRPDAAHRAWADGVDALHRAGRFDVRLADAYLGSLTPATLPPQRLKAVRVYTTLLAQLAPNDQSSSDQCPNDQCPNDQCPSVQCPSVQCPSVQCPNVQCPNVQCPNVQCPNDPSPPILRRHLAQLAPLLTDAELARVIDQPRDADPATWTFRPGAGAFLQQWWRGQDLLLATSENERLEEHLTRWVHATTHYTCPSRPSRLDDRGTAYLRFGPPYRQTDVDFGDGEFIREVFRFGVAVSGSDFPQNEFWTYTNVDGDSYYLFVRERRNCYRVGTANDLIPSHLRQYRGDSERGLNIAYSALMAMRHVYAQLALQHPDFSSRYTKVANYADWQEMQAMNREVEQRTGIGAHASTNSTVVGAGVGQTRTVSEDRAFGIDGPHLFVDRMVAEARREDAAAARRRARSLPRRHTQLLADAEPLQVAVRTARVLRPDGTTATRVAWGLRTADLRGDRNDEAKGQGAVIAVNAVRYDDSHRPQHTVWRRHVLRAQDLGDGRVLVPAPLEMGASTETVHLGLQWTQFDAAVQGAPRSPSVRLQGQRRISIARADSLAPLRSGGGLEMSDLQVRTPRAGVEWVAEPATDTVPYPFGVISAETPLLLAFEVYHLAFDPDDRTRYEIAYEVEQKTRRGWTRLFRGRDTKRTATTATYEGTTRRTSELIELALPDATATASPNRPRDVRITVRVTDAVTGERVEREVEFVVEAGGE